MAKRIDLLTFIPKEENHMNHRELFGHDLSGWKFVVGYNLELTENSFEFHPAGFADNPDKWFICLEKQLLLEIGKLLPPRRCIVAESLVLANEAKKIAFNPYLFSTQRSTLNMVEDHLEIIDSHKLTQLLNKTNANTSPFIWSTDLVSARIKHDEFLANLTLMLKK